MTCPERHIGLTSAVFLIFANVIGAGTFTTTGLILSETGQPSTVMVVWFLGGLIMLCGATCYGALARRLPESGGEYLILSRVFHPVFGCIAGWISLLVGFTAPIAVCAFALGDFFKPWTGLEPRTFGACLIILITMMHCFNFQSGLRIQNLIIIIKLMLLTVFLLLLARDFHTPAWLSLTQPFQENSDSLPLCLIWAFFGYSGWNSVIYIAGEIKKPEKNLLKASLTGSTLIMLLYLTLNLLILNNNQQAAWQNEIDFILHAARLSPNPWIPGVAFAVINLALFSSLSAMTMLGPRVYGKMADDGYLPTSLCSTHLHYRNPVIFQGILALLFLWLGTYKWMITYIGFTLGLSCSMTICALIRLRLTERNLPVPLWPFPPVIFLLAVLAATCYHIYHNPLSSLAGLMFMLPGILFWTKGRNKKTPHRQKQ